MTYLIFAAAIMFGIAKNSLPKIGGERFSGLGNIMSVNIITSVVGIAFFAVSGINFRLFTDIKFVAMAFTYGLATLGAQSLYIKALKHGPVSVCAMIYAFGFLIPTVVMAIYLKEKIGIAEIIGTAVIILSVILVMSSKKGGTVSSKSYLVFIFLAMFSSGTVGLLQKLFGHIFGKEDFDSFLFAAFLFMLLFSVVGKVALKSNVEKSEGNFDKRIMAVCILLALSNVLQNKSTLFLAAILPAVVFFPIYNGAVIILSAITSRAFFGEKINKYGWLGIALGVFAIVLITVI